MTGTLYVVDSNEHIVVYIRVNDIRRMYTVLNFLATFNHESDAWYQGYYNTTDSELLEDLAPISVEDEDDLINLARINTILLKYVGTNFDITTEDPKANRRTPKRRRRLFKNNSSRSVEQRRLINPKSTPI